MARYIDADKLIKSVEGNPCVTESIKSYVRASANGIPTADVQPVVHGENITNMNPVDEFICSECGIIIRDLSPYDEENDVCYEYEPNYCPNCGAKNRKQG